MTTVTVHRDAHGVCGLSVSGHAGYGRYGNDIVCAAASVLITTCANALESVVHLSPSVTEDEPSATISVRLPSGLSPEMHHDAQIVLMTALQGFQDIAAQYPKHLNIL